MLTQKQGMAENLPGGRSLTRAKSSITVPLSCARHWPYQAPGWQPGTDTTLNLLLRSFSDPWQYVLPRVLKDVETRSRPRRGCICPGEGSPSGAQPSIIVPLWCIRHWPK